MSNPSQKPRTSQPTPEELGVDPKADLRKFQTFILILITLLGLGFIALLTAMLLDLRTQHDPIPTKSKSVTASVYTPGATGRYTHSDPLYFPKIDISL